MPTLFNSFRNHFFQLRVIRHQVFSLRHVLRKYFAVLIEVYVCTNHPVNYIALAPSFLSPISEIDLSYPWLRGEDPQLKYKEKSLIIDNLLFKFVCLFRFRRMFE